MTRGFSVLPRLKNDKTIGIADVEAPEERGWQQPIHFYSVSFLMAAGVTKDIR